MQGSSEVVNDKSLLEFAIEVHNLAGAKGHTLVWQNGGDRFTGRCVNEQCRLKSEVVDDGKPYLTEDPENPLPACPFYRRNPLP